MVENMTNTPLVTPWSQNQDTCHAIKKIRDKTITFILFFHSAIKKSKV